MRDGFGHESPVEGETDDWITPKWIIDAFGDGYFDLDPCSSMTQPWKCAKNQYTKTDNGLLLPWDGNIFLNPPYGRQTGTWVRLLVKHGIGISLIFARVETTLWQ